MAIIPQRILCTNQYVVRYSKLGNTISNEKLAVRTVIQSGNVEHLGFELDITDSSVNAAIATPVDRNSCCATPTSDVAPLIAFSDTSENATALRQVNCSERKKLATTSTNAMTVINSVIDAAT